MEEGSGPAYVTCIFSIASLITLLSICCGQVLLRYVGKLKRICGDIGILMFCTFPFGRHYSVSDSVCDLDCFAGRSCPTCGIVHLQQCMMFYTIYSLQICGA